MFFLLRLCFWLGLVLLFIPLEPQGAIQEDDKIGPLQAANAAREVVADTLEICERKPDVCEAGKAAMVTIGVRAREGARIAYEYIGEKTDGEPTGSISKQAE